MKNVRLNEECIHCIISKYLKDYPESADDASRIRYVQGVLKILAEAKYDTGAPEIVEKISLLREKIFGVQKDYTEIKRYFNTLMLSIEDEVFEKIKKSEAPLKMALKYAMMGNYIDFGVIENVDEQKLAELLNNAETVDIDETEYKLFTAELKNAKNMVYLTDNCGEIVIDKLFIKVLKKMFPSLNVEVIVRGFPVLNDATMEDAKQAGLNGVASVISNGVGIAGTCLDRISDEARQKLDLADVILAKGQGNFETLRFCKKNVYYAFMCKCKMFADKFEVPRYTGMFINDLRL